MLDNVSICYVHAMHVSNWVMNEQFLISWYTTVQVEDDNCTLTSKWSRYLPPGGSTVDADGSTEAADCTLDRAEFERARKVHSKRRQPK